MGKMEMVEISMCAPTTRGPSRWGRHHCQTKWRDTVGGGDGKIPQDDHQRFRGVVLPHMGSVTLRPSYLTKSARTSELACTHPTPTPFGEVGSAVHIRMRLS